MSQRHLRTVIVVPIVAIACTATVTPPPLPDDPVRVFVLREALHTGVVLPPDAEATQNPEQFVEFGFGEWGWYALGDDAWYDVFATGMVPTQGTLSRRTFGVGDEAQLLQRVHWVELSPIVVSRAHAVALRRRLQQQFDATIGAVVDNPQYGFRFVPADEMYWFPYNCNDAVADWLEQLGCEVSWCPIRVGLTVATRDR